MKKIAISFLVLVLCATCGIGAFFFLREGKTKHETEQKPKPKLIGLQDITIQEGASLPESLTQIKTTDTVDTVEVDTGAVDTKKAGTYSIYYMYQDIEGKSYQEEIRCTVKAKDKEERKETSVPKSVIKDLAEVRPPKTGDESRIFSYIFLMLFSFTGVCGILYIKKKYRKI